MSVRSPRFTALLLLGKMDNQAYSNLALDSVLNGSELSERDKAFVSRIFYGVLERKLTLEYIISLYSKKPLQRLDSEVSNILKMGLYQLLYMDSVPDSAAVNESVSLAKQAGKSSAAGFVNGVLRSFIRDGKQVKYPENKYEKMSVEYSCNEEIVRLLCEDYSDNEAEEFLKSALTPHKTYIRANTLKTDADALVKQLDSLGAEAEKYPAAEGCITVKNLGSVEKLELFTEGLFHVQDLSSQLCCKALDPKQGDTVLDICAAPGG